MPTARGICAQKTAPTECASVKRDEVDDESGKTGDNRHALAALERPPDERAHDDDLQSGA